MSYVRRILQGGLRVYKQRGVLYPHQRRLQCGSHMRRRLLALSLPVRYTIHAQCVCLQGGVAIISTRPGHAHQKQPHHDMEIPIQRQRVNPVITLKSPYGACDHSARVHE